MLVGRLAWLGGGEKKAPVVASLRVCVRHGCAFNVMDDTIIAAYPQRTCGRHTLNYTVSMFCVGGSRGAGGEEKLSC